MSQGEAALVRDIADLLGVNAMPEEAIVDALGEAGTALGPDPDARTRRVRQLLQDHGEFARVSGGLFHIPSVLEGTSWTIWVDRTEAEESFVRSHPHLAHMVWWLVAGAVDLVDEHGASLGELEVEELVLDDGSDDVVYGPDGWLDTVAGGWAAVTVAGGGLRLSACPTPPEPTDAQIAALRTGFERAVDDDRLLLPDDPVPPDRRFAIGDSVIHEALIVDRGCFLAAPAPPLPELYRAAGLEERDRVIAPAGFDWDAFAAWRRRRRLQFSYRLEGRQLDALELVVGTCVALVEDGEVALGGDESEQQERAAAIATALADGEVAVAFWRQCEVLDIPVEARTRFVLELASRLDGPMAPGLAWVRARCLDLAGDVGSAVATLEQAVTSDCDHLPALLELAGFAADRGDAKAAYRLLEQAGTVERVQERLAEAGETGEQLDETDPELRLMGEVIEFAQSAPRPQAGRNEPCPCGSGRKYKACHLGRERHPLEDRAGWLYRKAERFLRGREPDTVAELAAAVARDVRAPGVRAELLSSGFISDLALHEHEVFGDFLAARDSLLPDDEALLAAQWMLVDRSVYEIEGVHRDRLDLYDVARGERLTVVNTSPREETRPGTFLVGRPLPVGDTYRAFAGFVEIPSSLVGEMLEAVDSGDPYQIAGLLGDLFTPRKLANTDGDELVFHTLRWRVADPAAVDGALRAAGLRPDNADAASEWRLVRDTTNMPNATIATLRIDGDQLIAEVNSDERADEVSWIVDNALPGAEFLHDEARDIEDLSASYDPDNEPQLLDQNDPEIRRVIEEHIAEQERRWLDQEIPALGGRTPREAAADPVGREQLERLLASFPGPTPDNPGTFDPDRIRRALGL